MDASTAPLGAIVNTLRLLEPTSTTLISKISAAVLPVPMLSDRCRPATIVLPPVSATAVVAAPRTGGLAVKVIGDNVRVMMPIAGSR